MPTRETTIQGPGRDLVQSGQVDPEITRERRLYRFPQRSHTSLMRRGEQKIKAPRSLREGLYVSHEQIDIVGGDRDSRKEVLAESLLPQDVDNAFSALIIDFSGTRDSDRLLHRAEQRGYGVVDWEASPAGILQMHPTDQVIDILAQSMKVSDDKQTQEKATIEKKNLLGRICRNLGEQQDGRGPSITMIHAAIAEILEYSSSQSDLGSVLTEEQRESLQGTFTDAEMSIHRPTLSELDAYLNALDTPISNPTQHRAPDSHVHLFNMRVPRVESGDDLNKRIVIQGIMRMIGTRSSFGQPETLVVIGAEDLSPESRRDLSKTCHNMQVRRVFVHNAVTDEVAGELREQGASLACLRIANGEKAQKISQIIGTEEREKQTGRSEEKGKSTNFDRGIFAAGRGNTGSKSRSFSIDDRPIVPTQRIQELQDGEVIFVSGIRDVSTLPFARNGRFRSDRI